MLLDTSFLIDLQRELGSGRGRGAQRFLQRYARATVWISLVTWMEFAEGYPPDQEDHCRLFLSQFPLILPDVKTAWRAAQISRLLRSSGKTIADHDLWLAATALQRNLALVTRNRRHFVHIAELNILEY